MSNPLPPNPCLVAVILVVKTTSEPCIAFHYPPRPGGDNSHYKDIFKDRSAFEESTTSSSDSGSQDSAAETYEPAQHPEDKVIGGSPPDIETGSASPQKGSGLHVDRRKSQWNDLFGFPSGVLARLLCPVVSSHKKRFEIGINDKVFIGRPMFAKQNGDWRRTRKERRSSSRSNTTAEKARRGRQEIKAEKSRTSSIEEEDSGASALATETDNVSDAIEEDGQHATNEFAADENGPKPFEIPIESGVPEKLLEHPLVMFHVVFVLKPPPLEYQIRVGEMHKKVVKKFNKALKLEQARTNFVAKEATLISSLTRVIRSTGNASSTDE